MNAGNVHDASAVFHLQKILFDKVKCPEQIHSEHLGPIFTGLFFQKLKIITPNIIVQNVKVTETIQSFFRWC